MFDLMCQFKFQSSLHHLGTIAFQQQQNVSYLNSGTELSQFRESYPETVPLLEG